MQYLIQIMDVSSNAVVVRVEVEIIANLFGFGGGQKLAPKWTALAPGQLSAKTGPAGFNHDGYPEGCTLYEVGTESPRKIVTISKMLNWYLSCENSGVGILHPGGGTAMTDGAITWQLLA